MFLVRLSTSIKTVCFCVCALVSECDGRQAGRHPGHGERDKPQGGKVPTAKYTVLHSTYNARTTVAGKGVEFLVGLAWLQPKTATAKATMNKQGEKWESPFLPPSLAPQSAFSECN